MTHLAAGRANGNRRYRSGIWTRNSVRNDGSHIGRGSLSGHLLVLTQRVLRRHDMAAV